MKKILSIIIFISLFSNVRADAGYCYCYEIEIETNHGLKSGFIRLNSYYEINSDSLAYPNYFKSAIIKINNSKKYIELHDFSIPIKWNSNDTITYISKTNVDTIDFEDITKINYVSTHHCYVGSQILNTLKLEDEDWVRKQPLRMEEFGYDVCGITVLVYENSKELNQLLINLKASTADINNGKPFYKIIKELNSFKVVVIESCSS